MPKQENSKKEKTRDEIIGIMLAEKKDGHLEKMAQNLLSLHDMTKREDFVEQASWVFRIACTSGNLDIIKFVLTSPLLKYKANVHENKESGLRRAIKSGNMEVVKYLLESPDLVEKAILNEEVFAAAVRQAKPEILRYFIFDKNFQKNEELERYMKKFKAFDVMNMFRVRDLKQKLNAELKRNEALNKTRKL